MKKRKVATAPKLGVTVTAAPRLKQKKVDLRLVPPLAANPPAGLQWLPHWAAQVSLFILIMGAYAITGARSVTMEDSGEFLTSAYFLGLDHPPGYPLYAMIAHLFTYLPFGTIAYRIHLFSALAATGACLCLYSIIMHVLRHQGVAIFGALMLAYSRTFWFQSVVAKFYPLNCFFFMAITLIGLRLQKRFQAGWLWCACFFYGLALANSWPLMILASGAFLCLLWPIRQHLLRQLPACLGFLALGLLPYSYLLLRSKYGGEIFFINPVTNLSELWAYIARSTYAAENVQNTWNLFESFKFISYFITMMVQEFGWLGGPMLALGFVVSFKKLPRLFNLALILAALSSSVFLICLWRAEFNELTMNVYTVYHLIPFGVFSLWLACAVNWLIERAPAPVAARPWLGWGAALATLVLAFVLNYRANNLSKDYLARDFAEMTLRRLPANAVLLVWGDADTGPFAYLNLVEKYRPDVLVTSQMGVIFPERPFNREVQTSEVSRAIAINSYLAKKFAEGRRVFSTRRLVFPDLARNFPYFYANRGLVDEITQTPQQSGFDSDLINETIAVMNKVVNGTYKSQWSYHRNILLRRYCTILAYARIDHELFRRSPDCRMAQVQFLAESERNYAQAADLLRDIMARQPLLPLQDRVEIARILFSNSINAIGTQPLSPQERLARYQRAFDEAMPEIERYPFCPNNLSVVMLDVRKQVPVNLNLARMQELFGGCPNQKPLLEAIRTAAEAR